MQTGLRSSWERKPGKPVPVPHIISSETLAGRNDLLRVHRHPTKKVFECLSKESSKTGRAKVKYYIRERY